MAEPSEVSGLSPGGRRISEVIASEQMIWWSEAMTAAFQKMLAGQTKQLQACVAEEAQKQQAMTAQVQRLLAEHTRQLEGCVAEEAQKQTRLLQGSPATRASGGGAAEAPKDREAQDARDVLRGRLEELLEQEMGERRTGEAGLRQAIEQLGLALARIEALFEPEIPPDFEDVAEDKMDTQVSKTRTTINDHMMGAMMSPSSPAHKKGHCISTFCRVINQSRAFTVCTLCVIVANSVYLGFEANAIMTSPGFTLPDNISWRLANGFFALLFLVELTIRWVADGATFLLPGKPGFVWNMFDTLLILITVAEELLTYFAVDMMTFGFLRLSRLLRVSRMMRAFKVVRAFKELKIMINGLLNCWRPLFWAGVMLLCLTYMMGILIAQLLTEYMISVQYTDLDAENMHAMGYITDHFPNLLESMYSLFEALAGGRDWGEIARPFRQIHTGLVVCLVLYIVVGIFCILNLLTAVFLEAAQRVDDVQELVYAKRDWVNETREFFLNAVSDATPYAYRMIGSRGRLSSDASPEITRDVFLKLLGDKSIVKFLEENGMDLLFMGNGRLKDLFSFIDKDNSGTLDVDELVASLYNLKGHARALDVRLDHQRTAMMINSLQKQLDTMQSVRGGTDPSPRRTTRVTISSRTHSDRVVASPTGESLDFGG